MSAVHVAPLCVSRVQRPTIAVPVGLHDELSACTPPRRRSRRWLEHRRSTNPTGDAALVRRAISRDAGAWAEILAIARPVVYAAAGRLGRTDERDDLLQDVMTQLIRSLATFRGDAPLRDWVASVCYNAVRSAWRRAKRARRLVPLDDVALHIVDTRTFESTDANGPNDLLFSALLALRCLSRSHQEVILHRIVLARSVADTARRLGVREGTIKSRLARALADVQVIAQVLRGAEIEAAAVTGGVPQAVARARVKRALPTLRAGLSAAATADLTARLAPGPRSAAVRSEHSGACEEIRPYRSHAFRR